MKINLSSFRRVFFPSRVVTPGIMVGLALLPVPVKSNPYGADVVSGLVGFNGLGTSNLTINQSSNAAIINWQNFSIGTGEVTRFVQPGVNSIAVNRVISGNPSAIYGQLISNGGVMVINPNGILVGPGGVIDVGGALTLSTLDASNEELLSGGSVRFRGSGGSVDNYGTVSGRDVIFLGDNVNNRGTMTASRSIAIGAGGDILVGQTADGATISVRGGGAGGATGISNTGAVSAGSVEMQAHGNSYAMAINNSGTVRASGYNLKGGRLSLNAGTGGRLTNTGNLYARQESGRGGQINISGGSVNLESGTVDASGERSRDGGSVEVKATDIAVGQDALIVADGLNGGSINLDASDKLSMAGTISTTGRLGSGGKVDLAGDVVEVAATAKVDASGFSGGQIRAGGGFQGNASDIRNSSSTSVSKGALLIADGGLGDGGEIILWSDGDTMFGGEVSARATGFFGNGGFIEVSGKNQLSFTGYARTGAANGINGTLLLDPTDVTIGASGPGLTMTDAVLLAAVLSNNVVISTSSSGLGKGDITINAGSNIQYDSPNSLSFFAHRNIMVNGDIKNHGTTDKAWAGTGNITLVAGWDGTNTGSFGSTIKAADIIAGKFGDYGLNGGSIFLNNAAAEPVEVGSARGETNAFGDIFFLTSGDNSGEFTQFGYRRENDTRGLAISGLGLDGLIGTADDVLIRTGFDLNFDNGVTGDINVYAKKGVYMLQHQDATADDGVKNVDRTYVMIGHGGIRENDDDIERRNNVDNLALGFTGAGATTYDAAARTADFGSDSGNVTVGNGDNHGNITVKAGGVLIMQAARFEGHAQIGHGGIGHDDPDYLNGLYAVSDRDRLADNSVNAVHIFGNMTGNINVTASMISMEGGRYNDTPVMIGHGGIQVRGEHFGNINVTTTAGGIVGRAAPDSNTGGPVNVNDGRWTNARDRSFIQIGNGGFDSDFLFLTTLGAVGTPGAGTGLDAYDTIGIVARPDDPNGIFMDARPGRTVVASGIVNTSLSGDGISTNRVRGRYSDTVAYTVNGVVGGVTNASFGHGGNITINSAGSFTMVAANGNDAYAMVGHGGRSTHGDHVGNITVNAKGNILFTREAWQVNEMGRDISDRGVRSHVQIGHGGGRYQGGSTGFIDVDAGGSIEFYAGRSESFAMIGHGGRGETSTSTNSTRGADQANGTHSGDITVDAGLGIKFRSGFGIAGQSFSQIGHGGYFQFADVTVANAGYALFGGGAVNALNEGHHGLISVNAHGGNIDFEAGQTETLTGQNWMENPRFESYTMIGHGGERARGDHSGLINVTATGDLRMVARGGWKAVGIEDNGALNNSDNGSGVPSLRDSAEDNSQTGYRNFAQIGHGGYDSDHQNTSGTAHHRDNSGKQGDGIGVHSLSDITLNIGRDIILLGATKDAAQLPVAIALGNGSGTINAPNFYVMSLAKFNQPVVGTTGSRYIRIRDLNAGQDNIGTAHTTPISLVFNGSESVSTVVARWNTNNPLDQITFDDGITTGNFIPTARTITLIGEDVTRVTPGAGFSASGGRLDTVVRDDGEIWKMPTPVQFAKESWAQIGNGGYLTDYRGSDPGVIGATSTAINAIDGRGHRGDITINAGRNILVEASNIKSAVSTGQTLEIKVLSGYNAAGGDAKGLATRNDGGGKGAHFVGPGIRDTVLYSTEALNATAAWINQSINQDDATSTIRTYAMIGLGGSEARGDHSGKITINGGGNLDLIAGKGNRAFAQIGSGGADSDRVNDDNLRLNDTGQKATIDIKIGGALNMKGGGLQNGDVTGAVAGVTAATALDTTVTDGSYVQIGSGGWASGGNHSGNISVQTGTGVSVEAGNSRGAYAQIGNGGRNGRSESITGNIKVISLNGDINLLGATPVVDSVNDATAPSNAGNIATGRESYVQIGNGGFDTDAQSATGQNNSAGNGGYFGNIEVVAAKGAVLLKAGGDSTINADNDRYRSLSVQIGNGGAYSDGDSTGNIRVSAGTNLTITGGKASVRAYSQIGHGGNDVAGNLSGTIDIEVGNNLTMQRGGNLDANGVIVRDAAAKIGHSTSNYNGNSGNGSGTRTGDILVSVGNSFFMLNGVNPNLSDTGFGALIGHVDYLHTTTGVSIGANGDTLIAVSRNNPTGTGKDSLGNPLPVGSFTVSSGSVITSADGGFTSALRLYMPSALQAQIATGAYLNSAKYDRLSYGGVGNRFGIDEQIATEHRMTTGALGEPVGNFRTPPEGDYPFHFLGMYNIYFAGPDPVNPPVNPNKPAATPFVLPGKIAKTIEGARKSESWESFDWPYGLFEYDGYEGHWGNLSMSDLDDSKYVPRSGLEAGLDAAFGPRRGGGTLRGSSVEIVDGDNYDPGTNSMADQEKSEDDERMRRRALAKVGKGGRVYFLYEPATNVYSSLKMFGMPNANVPAFSTGPRVI